MGKKILPSFGEAASYILALKPSHLRAAAAEILHPPIKGYVSDVIFDGSRAQVSIAGIEQGTLDVIVRCSPASRALLLKDYNASLWDIGKTGTGIVRFTSPPTSQDRQYVSLSAAFSSHPEGHGIGDVVIDRCQSVQSNIEYAWAIVPGASMVRGHVGNYMVDGRVGTGQSFAFHKGAQKVVISGDAGSIKKLSAMQFG
jgi:hypothetical protein